MMVDPEKESRNSSWVKRESKPRKKKGKNGTKSYPSYSGGSWFLASSRQKVIETISQKQARCDGTSCGPSYVGGIGKRIIAQAVPG
jgi:hypothetical protein